MLANDLAFLADDHPVSIGLHVDRPADLAMTEYLLLSKRTRQVFEKFISRNSPAKTEAVSKNWLTGAHPCTSSSMGMEYGAPESSRPWRLITGDDK